MELKAAQEKAKQLMIQHGLTDWAFTWDNAKMRLGQCSYKDKTISLSRILTIHRTEADTVNTILHEIAHALTPGHGHGHGRMWIHTAKLIGCTAERCSKEILIQGAWVGTCPNGHVFDRHRAPKVRSSCLQCSPRFNPNYLIVWEKKLG